MAKSSLGTLTVNILAKTAGIEQGTRKGRAAFRNLEKEVKQVEKAIGTSMKAAGAAVAGFAAATAYAVKQELALISTQNDLAKSMNATVTGIRAVNMAAESNSIDGLDGSLARFTRRLGAVANGGGPAAAAVKALKLDVEQLGKVDADEKLALVADAIKNAGISSQQATRYLQDMGFEQRGIYNIFKDGGDSIRQYREQVEAYGLAVSEIDAEKIGIADNAFTTLGRTIQGLTTQLSGELSGILAASAEEFEEWSLGGVDSVNRVSSAVNGTIDAIGFLMDAVEGVKRSFELAGSGIAVAMLSAQSVIFGMASAVINGPIDAVNELIAALNKLPKVVIEPLDYSDLGEQVKNQITLATLAVQAGLKDMHEIAMRPMPSESFKKWVADAREASEKVAAAVVAGRKDGPADDPADDPVEETRIRLSAELQALVDYHKEKEQLLLEQYEREQEILWDALGDKKIGYEDYTQAILNIDKKLKDSQKKLDQQTTQERPKLSGELQALVDYHKEKEQLLEEQLKREREIITKDALEKGELQDDHITALINAEKKYNDQIDKMEANRNRMKLQGARQFFGNLSTLMNTESRKLFEIGKAAAYAGAVVDGFAAAVAAHKAGMEIGGPSAPAIAAAFAAASIAATGVQIAAIANTQFGGGTAAVSNTQAVNAVTEPVQSQAPVATQEIYLRGIDPDRMYDGAQVLEALNRQIEDGGRIVGVV